MFLYVVYLFHSSFSMGNLLVAQAKKGNEFWATGGCLTPTVGHLHASILAMSQLRASTPTMGHLHALTLIAKSTIYMLYNESFICWAMLCHETRSCLRLLTMKCLRAQIVRVVIFIFIVDGKSPIESKHNLGILVG